MNKLKRYLSWEVLGVAVLSIGIFSVWELHECRGDTCSAWLDSKNVSWPDAFFYTFQMLLLNYGGFHGDVPWTLQVPRFGLPLLTYSSIVIVFFELLASRHLSWRIRCWRDHLVFCGCSDQARALIREYLAKNKQKKIIVVDMSDAVENKKLADKGVLFLKDAAQLRASLEKVRVKQARCVYLMAETDQVNMEIFKAWGEFIESDRSDKWIASEKSGQQTPLKRCYLHLYDSTLKSAVDKQLEAMRSDRATPRNKDWEVHTFNTWANSARVLFTGEHGPHHHCSDTLQPHTLILGKGCLAEQLIIQAARLGHYSGHRKARVTYIDEDAADLREKLYAQYPVLDPEFESAEHMAWHQQEKSYLPVIDTCFIAQSADCLTGKIYSQVIKDHPVSVVYICHPDDDKALRILAALKWIVTAPNSQKPRVVLCDPHGNNLNYFSETDDPTGFNVHYFDADSEGVKLKENEDVIEGAREAWARQIHEHFNKKYQIGDWTSLPEDMRDSNRQSADHWQIKLDWLNTKGSLSEVVALHQNDLMRLEHDRWCAERFMSGWRYCEKPNSKDDEKIAKRTKKHWCLCSFDQLDPTDQIKDQEVCEIAYELLGINMPKKFLKRTLVVQVEFADQPGCLQTLEGMVPYQAGDALMTGIQHERWPIARVEFDASYQAVFPTVPGENGGYIKDAIPVSAVQLTKEIKLILPDGITSLSGKTDDWLLTGPDSSQWIVDDAIFRLTYLPIDAGNGG